MRPSRQPDDKTEVKIGGRVREIRVRRQLEQSKFARLLGLTRDQLASVECGRVPLRYAAARRAIGADLSVIGNRPFNPVWLFDGTGEIQLDWPFYLPSGETLGLPPKYNFSSFAAEHLAILQDLAGALPSTARVPETWLKKYLLHLGALLQKLESESAALLVVQGAFLNTATDCASRSKRAAKLLRGGHKPLDSSQGRGEVCKQSVDMPRRPANIAAMRFQKDPVGSLLTRVRRLLSPRGAQSGLARELGVSRQAMNRLLAGKALPSAKITLHLLQWVEAEEAKQKRPSIASTVEEQQTRHPKSHQ